jgi:hypothetical protein
MDTTTPIDTYIAATIGQLTLNAEKLDLPPLRNYKSSRELDEQSTGGITKDVAFNRLDFDGGDTRSPFDDGHIDIGDDDIRVELVQDFDDEDLQKVFSYAINATLGIDPENPPAIVDWEEMLEGGLQTALEDIRIAFGVYRVSRASTHQIVRSRRAAFHQQSMRAHYYGETPGFRMPESVWASNLAREAFLEAMVASHRAYAIACAAGVSYQDARYILPEGTVNYILCEYSLAEFINVYAYRACSMFQWEIVSIMRQMKEVLCETHPWLAKYILISCEKTHGAKDTADFFDINRLSASEREQIVPEFQHTCTFQGWEEVEGQCDFPWARETNRAFKSKKHGIGRGPSATQTCTQQKEKL